MDAPYNSVIVRFSGEIALKSRGVRDYWERLIVERIKRRVKDELLREGLRIFVVTDNPSDVISKLRFIFGLTSFSPAIMVKANYADIEDAVLSLVDYLKGIRKAFTFGIFIEKNLSEQLDSRELKVKLGNRIREDFGLVVDLENADIPVFLDIRKDKAFVFNEKIDGPGGLPMGTQDMLVSMYSGGPDSTLASWMCMRRGSPIILVYLDFGGEPLRSEALERVLRGADRLSLWGGVNKLYVIDFDEVIAEMREKVSSRVIYLLFKRYMFRVGKLLVKKEGARGIVSGEIIGEQASQTVQNLAIISQVVSSEIPIFRPLIGFDKDEVLRKLKKIDEELYTIAAKSVEPCKTLTEKPRMNLTLDAIQSYERKIGIGDSTLKRLINSAEVIRF